MTQYLDQKMLTGFVLEAQDYLPQLREQLTLFHQDATQREALEEAFRYAHTIKGASAMIGLSTLSRIAHYVETTLEAVVNDERPLDTACVSWVVQVTEQLHQYLDALVAGDMQQPSLVAEIVQAFRRFKHLPARGDAAAVTAILTASDAAFEQQESEEPASADEAPFAVLSEEIAAVAAAALPVTAPAAGPEPTAEPAGTLNDLLAQIDADIHQVYGQHTMSTVRTEASDGLAQAERYILFAVGESRYAVPVPHVLEIGRIPRITPVPNVPEWMRGVINLRGDILSVIDFRAFLGLEEHHQTEKSRMLVVKTPGDEITTSLIVDQVMGIIPLTTSRLALPTTVSNHRAAPYLAGAYEHDQHICAVFDLERLLLSPEIRQFE